MENVACPSRSGLLIRRLVRRIYTVLNSLYHQTTSVARMLRIKYKTQNMQEHTQSGIFHTTNIWRVHLYFRQLDKLLTSLLVPRPHLSSNHMTTIRTRAHLFGPINVFTVYSPCSIFQQDLLVIPYTEIDVHGPNMPVHPTCTQGDHTSAYVSTCRARPFTGLRILRIPLVKAIIGGPMGSRVHVGFWRDAYACLARRVQKQPMVP